MSETELLRSNAVAISPVVAQAVDEAIGDAEVLAGVVALEGDVARAMALTEAGFCLVEVTRTGDRLIVTTPVWRIRRVVEARVNAVTTVTVELDADRSIQRQEADGSVSIMPAGYDIGAAAGADGEVLRFAAAMRQAILGSGPVA